jgi:hypothetical protein
MILKRRLTLSVVAALFIVGCTARAEERIPVIPGAWGFGINTPAGSGRHLDVAPDPGLAKAVAGRWIFDDGTPEKGKITGDASLIERGDGRALRLAGKGALKAGDPAGYVEPGGAFTIMAWVRLDAVGGILAENRSDGGSAWELGTTASFGGKWRFYVVNAEGEKRHATWSSALSPGRWRHMTGVYNDEGRVRLYLNGNRVHSGWNKTIKGVAATRSSHLQIGRGLKGQLDDVMLFNRGLSDEEVLAFFAQQQDGYFDTRTEVYRVTNLNDSGPGSLREGIVTQERARNIVFEVSGNIALKSPIGLGPNNSYLTVEGATAPSPGITIKDRGFRIGGGSHDVLFRHLRIRTGDTTIFGRLPDGWTDVDGDGPGTVYSHPLKVSPQKAYGGGNRRSVWYNDKNLVEDPRKTKNVGMNKWDWDPGVEKRKGREVRRSDKGMLYVNVGEDPSNGRLEYGKYKSSVIDPIPITSGTRNIVLDHLSCTWAGDMNMQTQGSHVTIRNCLSAEALHHPKHPKGGHSRGLLVFAYGPNQGEYTTVIGNLFAFNMARNPTVSKGHMVMVANNFISDVNVGIKLFDSTRMNSVTAAQANVIQRANAPFLARVTNKETPEKTKTYISPGNMVDGRTFDSVEDIWRQVVTNPFKAGTQPKSARVTTSPVTVPGMKLKPVEEVREWVLSTAGARPADRDPADRRIIANVKTGRGKLPIASQEEVGGWPELAENHRHLTPPENPDADDDGDGYTNLEEWLHGFAAEVEVRADY